MTTEQLPKVVDGQFEFKALRFSDYASPLQYETVHYPAELDPTTIVIKTKASSVNPADVLLKGIAYWFMGDRSKGFGSDFSGEVVKTGSESKYKPGDKIFGIVYPPLKANGAFGEYIVHDETKFMMCFKIPDGLDFAEAASLPIAAGTAYQGLGEHANLKDKNVLILGAGTSVGSYGVQFAKHFYGAKNVVATCSPSSAPKVKSYGADLIVDYTKGEKSKVAEVLDFVEKNGKFDIILDTVRDGSFYPITNQVLQGSANGGVYTKVAGSTTLDYGNAHFKDLLPTFASLKYGIMGRFYPHWYARHVVLWLHDNKGFADAVAKMMKEDKFHVVLDSKWDGMTQYDEAIQKVAQGKAKGKVVVTF